MGSLSIWHWMIVLAVGLLLFGGRGKISELMGDVAKGIKSFKKGMAEEENQRSGKWNVERGRWRRKSRGQKAVGRKQKKRELQSEADSTQMDARYIFWIFRLSKCPFWEN